MYNFYRWLSGLGVSSGVIAIGFIDWHNLNSGLVPAKLCLWAVASWVIAFAFCQAALMELNSQRKT